MIEFKGINKTINEKKILQDINMKIEKGELVTFIGPSGSMSSSYNSIFIQKYI